MKGRSQRHPKVGRARGGEGDSEGERHRGSETKKAEAGRGTSRPETHAESNPRSLLQ